MGKRERRQFAARGRGAWFAMPVVLCFRVLAGLLVLLLLALPLSPPARALDANVEAPSFTFDRKLNRYIYTDAKLTLGSLVLYADSLAVLPAEGKIKAEGRVRFVNGTLYGNARRLEMSTQDKSGVLEDASLFDSATGYRMEAETMEMAGDGSFYLKGCSLTTCPPEVIGWRLDTRTLEITGGDLAISRNTTLRIGVVPVLWLPIFAWPTARERQSGFLVPRLVRHSSSLERLNLGWRLKVPLFIALDPEHDITLEPEHLQKRGPALGAEYQYAFFPGMRGRARLWGIREQLARNPETENDFLAGTGTSPGTIDPYPRRSLGEWTHSMSMGSPGRLTAEYAHGSDGQVYREYEQSAEYRPYRSWQGGTTWQTVAGDFSLSAEHRPEYVAESLFADSETWTTRATTPRINHLAGYRLGARPFLAVPLGLELGLGQARYTVDEGLSGEMLLSEPGLTVPLELGAGVRFRGRVSRRLVRHSALEEYVPPGETAAEPQEQSFGQQTVSAELGWTLGRTFYPRGGSYEALRHRITPRVVFSSRSDVPQPYEGQVLYPRSAMKVLALRLDNVLLGRPAPQSTGDEPAPATVAPGSVRPARELLRLDIIQRYNLMLADRDYLPQGPRLPRPGETHPGEPMLPLRLEGELSWGGLEVDTLADYHHQRGEMTRSRFAGGVRWGESGRFNMAYHYNAFTYRTPEDELIPRASSLEMGTSTGLGSWLSISLDGRFNLKDDPPPLGRRLDRASAVLHYHPRCYSLRVAYVEKVVSTEEEGRTRYFVERQVTVRFDITSLVAGEPLPPRPFE
ncbi:MAG: hypothetical protein OEZ59_00490 [Deltaproteobacteria bacterium]|nr:hypothetical protein [Deltaproteobacteria bacterium]